MKENPQIPNKINTRLNLRKKMRSMPLIAKAKLRNRRKMNKRMNNQSHNKSSNRKNNMTMNNLSNRNRMSKWKKKMPMLKQRSRWSIRTLKNCCQLLNDFLINQYAKYNYHLWRISKLRKHLKFSKTSSFCIKVWTLPSFCRNFLIFSIYLMVLLIIFYSWIPKYYAFLDEVRSDLADTLLNIAASRHPVTLIGSGCSASCSMVLLSMSLNFWLRCLKSWYRRSGGDLPFP